MIIAVGAALVVAVAVAVAMSTSETIELSAIATGAAAAGAVGGWLMLRLVRSRAFAVQVAMASLVTLVSAMVGIWGTAQLMFIGEHDLQILSVMLIAAASVAAATAVIVGERTGRAVDVLVDTARRIGDGAADGAASPPLPGELARVHDELTLASTRLEAARLRERTLESSRRELVAWVSHDLRTPLAGIRALTEALEDRVVDDPETVGRYHRALRIEAERLSGLVDDLFELSRAQAGVLQLEFEPVSLGDLVSDAIASATPIAVAKGIHLEGRFVGAPSEFQASAPEVLRALRNVLDNAIRHTPHDGTVTIEGGVERGRAYVMVTDTGGGIAPADLPRVFDTAFRGDEARTSGNGAGLGLAIAQGIMEAHRGDITVRNENGGACFTLRLPLVQADHSS